MTLSYSVKCRDYYLLLLFIYLTFTEVKVFTIENICIAVAMPPLNDKDRMLIKVNEKNLQRKTKYNG